MASARRALLPVTLMIAALLAAGCGAGTSLVTRASSTRGRHASAGGSKARRRAGGAAATPAPAPTGGAADPAAVKVIEGWSSALRRGEVRTAALYFRIPSVFFNGPGSLVTIHNLAEAEAANEGLPCGARFISADQRGRYVNALFRLTGRSGPGGSACGSGPGETARTDFVIDDGRITEWIRAPDDPGDNGSPRATPPASPSPGGTPLV
jgi:hypothetical protein